MLRNAVRTAALALAFGLAAVVPAHAIMREVPLTEMVRTADAVVRAQVLTMESSWTPDHRGIRTEVTLTVSESWKGAYRGAERIRIELPGGRVGETLMQVEDQPEIRPGDDVVLFLRGSATDHRIVVHNDAQGAYHVVGARAIGIQHLAFDLNAFRTQVRNLVTTSGR
jgi:hypothetical protein